MGKEVVAGEQWASGGPAVGMDWACCGHGLGLLWVWTRPAVGMDYACCGQEMGHGQAM